MIRPYCLDRNFCDIAGLTKSDSNLETRLQMEQCEDVRARTSRKKIIVLASVDLFSESLIHAVQIKFNDYDIVVHDEPSSRMICEQVNVELILMYQISTDNFLDILRALRNFHPEAAIGLVVKDADEFGASIEAIVAEQLIHGILPFSLSLDVCLAAVELMIKGGEHFPSALLGRLAPGTASGQPSGRDASVIAIADRRPSVIGNVRFTMREAQIFDLMRMGTSNKVIASTLKVSENTVKVHTRNIFRKLKVRNRTEATSRYFSTEELDDR